MQFTMLLQVLDYVGVALFAIRIVQGVADAMIFNAFFTVAADLATANSGLISDIISCPGLDYCSLATARSIPIALSGDVRWTISVSRSPAKGPTRSRRSSRTCKTPSRSIGCCGRDVPPKKQKSRSAP